MFTLKLDTILDELLIRIFEELDLNDLLNCSLTCHLFYNTIRDALVLQYRIEQAAAGVEDSGTVSRLTTAERLTHLKAVQHGWANLRFRQRYSVQVSPGNLWELFGGVIGQGVMTSVTRGLSFMELPSAVRGTPGRRWRHRDMGVDIRDFAMDPAQDLTVLIATPVSDLSAPRSLKYLIHLRAMSTGGNHPHASDPVLSCIPSPNDQRIDFIIQIMGNYLAVLFHTIAGPGQDQLYIWDWSAGQLLTYLMVGPPDRVRIDSFLFLSPQHFVIARFQPDAYAEDPPTLEVYDFLATRAEGSTNPRLVRSFQLPQIADNAIMISIIIRSDPAPEYSSHYPPSPFHDRPFFTAPSARLLTVSMEFFRQRQDVYGCVLFVHSSSLLEYLEASGDDEDTLVLWEDWGPHKSRLLPTLTNELTWVCYVHGTRYVRLEPAHYEPPDIERSHLRLLDFNPLVLRRDTSSSPPGQVERADSEVILASQPTVIPEGECVFEAEVSTTLPYLDVLSNETFPYTAVMIEEDCIIGLLRGAISEGNGYEFLCI